MKETIEIGNGIKMNITLGNENLLLIEVFKGGTLLSEKAEFVSRKVSEGFCKTVANNFLKEQNNSLLDNMVTSMKAQHQWKLVTSQRKRLAFNKLFQSDTDFRVVNKYLNSL